MYENIGRKIKGLAIGLFVLGAAASILMGIYIMFFDAGNGNSNLAVNMIISILVMVIGCLVSWVSSWVLYGFGELIDTVEDIEYLIHKRTYKQTIDSEQVTKQSGEYICPKCHMSNDSAGACERCGYIIL